MKGCFFIIGGSRTGSELLKAILEKYTTISFVNEMHLLAPRWLRKDFKTVVNQVYGGFGDKIFSDNILQLIDDKQLDGYYWTEFDSKVNRDEFSRLFDGSKKQLSDVLDAAMAEKVKTEKKELKGAKFPVHYAFTDKLIHWYPNAKLIHTVRDPRGIYYSQSRKYFNENDSKYIGLKVKILQFIHIVIQSFLTSLLHLKYKNQKNYFFACYEDMLGNPNSYFKSLCHFLGVSFDEKITRPEVFRNSSFTDKRGSQKGLDKSSITSWRQKLPLFEYLLITLFTLPSLIIFSYTP